MSSLNGSLSDQLKKITHQIAKERDLPGDWINSWYSGFTHNLPKNFGDRLELIFQGKKITAYALSAEDMLILKCCAHRPKDVSHARILIRKNPNHQFVRKHLKSLIKKKLLPDEKAVEFLDDILDRENVDR